MNDCTQANEGDGFSHHSSPITHYPDDFSHHSSPITHHQPPFGRLRWHSRRGMLELDILLARFWARWESEIGAVEAVELEKLLDLEDNDLLALILHSEDFSANSEPGVLRMLREC